MNVCTRVSAVGVAIVATAMMIVACASSSARSSLARAASVDYPSRFVFVDRPDATNLMECLGVTETLVVTVDADQNVMAVRREGQSNPAVIWTGDASFVDSSLLTAESGWIWIERDLAASTRADIEAALGSSLAEYVFAERIAPDPIAVARSALVVAGTFSGSESSSGDVTVSVEIDGSVGVLEGLGAGSIPDLTFRIVGGRIVAITARLPAAGDEEFGFVWEYDQTANVPAVEIPKVATGLSDVVGIVGPGDRGPDECSLGL